MHQTVMNSGDGDGDGGDGEGSGGIYNIGEKCLARMYCTYRQMAGQREGVWYSAKVDFFLYLFLASRNANNRFNLDFALSPNN